MSEAYSDRQQDEYRKLIYLAWHTEALARAKKLPKLEKLLKVKKSSKIEKKEVKKEDLLNVFSKKELLELAERRDK